MEYAILSGTINDLDAGVNKLIKEGWMPQGGVSKTMHNGYQEQVATYAQAMIRESK